MLHRLRGRIGDGGLGASGVRENGGAGWTDAAGICATTPAVLHSNSALMMRCCHRCCC